MVLPLVFGFEKTYIISIGKAPDNAYSNAQSVFHPGIAPLRRLREK